MRRSPFPMLLIALFASGCATETPDPVSIPYWQKSLERYVWNQADGDPNVLRDLSWDDVHKGFAVISDPLPERSVDAIGLLVAHRPVAGRRYFIFLVAIVREQVIEDMRAVALNVEAGEFHWSVGPPNAGALNLYRGTLIASESPGPPNPRSRVRFPAPEDTFRVLVDVNRVSIQHDQSEANWEVDVDRSAPTSQPALTELIDSTERARSPDRGRRRRIRLPGNRWGTGRADGRGACPG